MGIGAWLNAGKTQPMRAWWKVWTLQISRNMVCALILVHQAWRRAGARQKASPAHSCCIATPTPTHYELWRVDTAATIVCVASRPYGVTACVRPVVRPASRLRLPVHVCCLHPRKHPLPLPLSLSLPRHAKQAPAAKMQHVHDEQTQRQQPHPKAHRLRSIQHNVCTHTTLALAFSQRAGVGARPAHHEQQDDRLDALPHGHTVGSLCHLRLVPHLPAPTLPLSQYSLLGLLSSIGLMILGICGENEPV